MRWLERRGSLGGGEGGGTRRNGQRKQRQPFLIRLRQSDQLGLSVWQPAKGTEHELGEV